ASVRPRLTARGRQIGWNDRIKCRGDLRLAIVFPERRVPLCLRQAALLRLPCIVADRASLLGCPFVKERGSLVRGGGMRVRRSLPFESLAVPVRRSPSPLYESVPPTRYVGAPAF